jgi:hypothetical protein
MKLNRPQSALLFCLVFSQPVTAWAYIDPGTGSMILQFVIFALVSIAIFFRQIWGAIKSLFSSPKEKVIPSDTEDPSETPAEEQK